MRISALPEDEGQRIDIFLKGQLDLSRNNIQKLIEDNMITCRGGKIAKNYRVRRGDEFEITLPPPAESAARGQEIPLDIICEDADIIVVNKPVGMVVHPAAGHRDGTLVNALIHHCGESLSGIGGVLRPGIVHRIDRDTSGLLIAAKNDRAHNALAAQLKDHSMSRVYSAVLIGAPIPGEGIIDAPIGRHPVDRKRLAVTERNSRLAVTRYRTLERYRGYSFVECRLETGRTHQIRVHMAHIGHPVAGDPVYGGRRPALGLDHQCLHARELTFTHPSTGERVTLKCPLPEYFQSLLTKLRQEFII